MANKLKGYDIPLLDYNVDSRFGDFVGDLDFTPDEDSFVGYVGDEFNDEVDNNFRNR